MNILAFDTATDACTVALRYQGEVLSFHQIQPQQQAGLLLPNIDRLMAQAGITASQLDGVVFGRGPGSFTGLRIAASAAQGIAFGADVGVLGVSTMATLAQGCHRATQASSIVVLLDARLHEVYCARYLLSDSGTVAACSEEQLLSPANVGSIMPDVTSFTITGSGLDEYDQEIQTISTDVIREKGRLPEAVDLITLADGQLSHTDWQAAESALPVYIRDKVALTEAERENKHSPQ